MQKMIPFTLFTLFFGNVLGRFLVTLFSRALKRTLLGLTQPTFISTPLSLVFFFLLNQVTEVAGCMCSKPSKVIDIRRVHDSPKSTL